MADIETVKTWTIEKTSTLNVDRETLWRTVTTMEGANFELMPLIRMSIPREARGKSISDVPLGEVAFRSWLWAFGIVPFDRHALCLINYGNFSFHEESSSWLQKLWRHERVLEKLGDKTVITDRVTFTPRATFLGPLVKRVVDIIFTHRHRRLAAQWSR